MTNDQSIQAQPELYRCNCCDNYSTTCYDLVIRSEYEDEGAEEGTGEFEWPFRLCRHCYFNWFEGRMSTRDLWWACKHSISGWSKKQSPD